MKTIWGIILLSLTAGIFFALIDFRLNVSYSVGSFFNTEPEAVSEAISQNKSIYFLGDIMLARDVDRRLFRAGGLSYAFENIAIDPEAAFAVANFEAVIPKIHIPTKDFGFLFSVREDLAVELKTVGITHLSLANNHSYDFGTLGFLNTIEVLKKSDIIPFGLFDKVASTSVTILDTGNQKVGIIGLMGVDKFWSETELSSAMNDLASSTDLQVVFIHWGPEYQVKRSISQRSQAEILAKLGADLIIGHHPHVVQGIEIIDNALVVYSLGNFIFDQYFSTAVQTGLVVKLIQEDQLALELKPVSNLEKRVQPKFLEGDELKINLEELAKNSDPELEGQILSGKIILPMTLATSTKEAMMAI